MTATGHVKTGLIVNAISLLINIILNLILIPETFIGIKMIGLGTIGAAYSFLASIFFLAIMGKYYAYSYTSTVFYYELWKHIICSFITFQALFFIKSIYYTIYFLPLYFLVILFLFFGLMSIFREFGNKEISFYLSLINPNNIKDYIKNEIR